MFVDGRANAFFASGFGAEDSSVFAKMLVFSLDPNACAAPRCGVKAVRTIDFFSSLGGSNIHSAGKGFSSTSASRTRFVPATGVCWVGSNIFICLKG